MHRPQLDENKLLADRDEQLFAIGFQKNYPKNIFMPIVEHLSDIGLQEMYQRCVGTRQLFQGKNVVSLAVLYNLFKQKQFTETIDKSKLLSIVCSKILFNSKIKKKIFHLKMAKQLITHSCTDQRQFKTFAMKQVSLLSTSKIHYQELILFSNLNIYLMHLIIQAVCRGIHKQPCTTHVISNIWRNKKFASNKQENEGNQNGITSKQQFRLYLNVVTKIFNDYSLSIGQFSMIYKKIDMLLQEKQAKFQEKYESHKGIFNTKIFMKEVVSKLFQCKQKGIQITILLLCQWINNFKEKCTVTKTTKEKIEKNATDKLQISHQQKSRINLLQISSFAPQKFTPFILISPFSAKNLLNSCQK